MSRRICLQIIMSKTSSDIDQFLEIFKEAIVPNCWTRPTESMNSVGGQLD